MIDPTASATFEEDDRSSEIFLRSSTATATEYFIANEFSFSDYKSSFLAGTIGLSTAFAVMHPLDTIKTRLQARSSLGSSNWNEVIGRNIWKTLRKGFFSSVVGAGPQGGARLSTYEYCKSELLSAGVPTLLSVVVAAVSGDLASSLVKVPREVITSRLQASNSSFSSVCREIYYSNGFLGFFKGFWSTTSRDVPFMIILFSSYETIKSNLKKEGETLPTIVSVITGGFSGALAGFLTTPFDVLKTRIMTSKSYATDSTSMASVAINVYNRWGVKGFFTGSLARSFWWFGICGIFFPIYENVKLSFQSKSQQ